MLVMELREFFRIFIVHKILFWSVIGIILGCGVIFFLVQPQTYKATLLLNVTRDTPQQTAEYTYDQYYRLQADERFADTVVKWLGSSHFEQNIGDAKGIDAKRLSSQMIEVTYITQTSQDARNAANAIIEHVNALSQKINTQQKDTHWFMVQGEEPVVHDHTVPFYMIVIGGLFIGLCCGFWVVLARHYVIGSK